MFRRKKIILSVFFCILACYGSSTAQIKEGDKSFITLKFSDEHMNTFYNLENKWNRKISFEAIRGINVKGNIESNISEERFNALINEVGKSNFFSLKDSYTSESKPCPWIMLDSPTIIISVKLNGKEKTITHYLGCGEKVPDKDSLKPFPKPLFDFEDKIIEIAKTNK